MKSGNSVDTTRLNAYERHLLVTTESVEHTDCVRSTPNTRDHDVRKLPGLLKNLSSRLVTDNGLEVPDDGREGVGSDGAPNAVVCGSDVGDPVAHCLG